MTQSIFIGRGNGYAGCTAFDGFTVLAAPVAEREARIFGGTDGKPGSGTCYRAYEIKLACRTGEEQRTRRDLFMLISHGGGREVVRVPAFYDAGETQAGLLALPERVMYGVLFTIYKAAQDAATVARQETGQRYGRAFLEGRMRKTKRGNIRSLKLVDGYWPTVNGAEISEGSCKTATDAQAAAAAYAAAQGLTDARLGWVSRA